MPVLRYFVFVGAVLLALLFVCDAVLPNVPLPSTFNSRSDVPTIRIQSERKWPERVVIDTSIPTPVTVAKVETLPPAANGAAKLRAREAFAQMPPVPPKAPAQMQVADRPAEKAAASGGSKTASKTAEVRHPVKRKVARAHPQRPMIMVAQQPHFGWFNFTW